MTVAYEINPYAIKITLVAAADLSTKQYAFVRIDSNGKAAACTAVTDRPIGVLQNAPTSGQEAEITVAGGSKVVAGTVVAAGNVLSITAAGLALPVTAGTAVATQWVLGTALTPAAAANGVITAVVNCSSAARAS